MKVRKFPHYYLVGLINSMELVVGKPYLFLTTAKTGCNFGCEYYSDLKNSSKILLLEDKIAEIETICHIILQLDNNLLARVRLCYGDNWEIPEILISSRRERRMFVTWVDFITGPNCSLDVRGWIKKESNILQRSFLRLDWWIEKEDYVEHSWTILSHTWHIFCN